jgi:c-di-GMP-binding flagellar brake protein YcgR
MPPLHFRRVERRRTPRVAVSVNLTIQGNDETNEKFRIQARSHSVSGHGGMTILDTAVVLGHTLLVTNESSGEKTECRVVSVRPAGDGKHVVAFEFIAPNADFWKMTFPVKGTKPLRRMVAARVAL